MNKTKGKSKQAVRYLFLALLLGLLSGQGCVSGIRVPQDHLAPAKPAADKVLFFVADGMRPDLMEGYARQGFMPAYTKLMDEGVRGINGMVPPFPTNSVERGGCKMNFFVLAENRRLGDAVS